MFTPSRNMNLFLVLTAIAPLASSISNKDTYELEIHKDRTISDACSFLSIVETQRHKGLRGVLTELVEEPPSPLFPSERDSLKYHSAAGYYYKFYSYHLPPLVERAESLCGSRLSWEFTTYFSPKVIESIEILPQFQENTWSQIHLSANDGSLQKLSKTVVPDFEVVPLFTTGQSSNRVDITFFGDGLRPLLNFWAAFAASNESGIGVDGKPKDTTFGLYRDGTELRAVYYAKPDVAAASCASLGDSCDYPILLANDPLYGGLGGRFTVTTSSKMNGALVLRHELGHSIILEGEEYDGGYAYYGPNAAQNLSTPFPWAHWLMDGDKHPRAERSIMPMQAYPWTILSLDSPWTVKFNSSGQYYARHLVRFSLSAIPEAKHLNITLDGEEIRWTPMPGIGVDRWHYDVHRNETLSDGEHTLSFSLQEGSLLGLALLCSAEIIEFGDVNEFNATEGHISAYPTFSDKNVTTYRPTNENCLMRVVTSPDFCKVCVEGLWHVLLERVNLIDSVSTKCTLGKRSISLNPVKLGQFRDLDAGKTDPLPKESLLISWSRNGLPLPQYENRTEVVLGGANTGNFTVDVHFFTEEVRVDPRDFLTDSTSIEIDVPCGVE